MNKDTLEGNWKQLKGKVRAKWGQITDDEIDVINGRRQELAGKLQERYGMAREQADREIDEFLKSA
jgi:uncharacterized protein YjbJ (UPF0337 family)